VPDPIPQTQKGQLDGFYSALGVPVGDFAAAMTALAGFKNFANWQNDQQAIFTALGATDQAGAITAITTLKAVKPPVAQDDTEKNALFAALGVTDQAGAIAAIAQMKTTGTHYSGLLAILEVKDQSAAIVAIGGMKSAQGNHDALVKALGATDHATAVTAATNIDATVALRVKQQAASAGLPEPVPKSKTPAGDEKTERPISARSRLAATINEQIAK
jgi:hypothetical protein